MPVEIKFSQLFINNEFVNSESGKTFPTYNPATEEVIANVQEADSADVDKAVAAARQAFRIGSEWRSMEPAARGALLYKFAQLLRRDKEYLASLESLNNGKHLNEALFDIDFAAGCIEYFAGWSDKVFGKTIPVDSSFFTYTRHEPIGVCAGIITLTYPTLMFCWKIGPALACGNTIVIKPSEFTPLTALYCASLLKEAGFPAGVVNVVPGYGPIAGHSLSMHNDVNKISFTGSTQIGREIQLASARSNLKRVTLGLGGKSPLIVCDVDDEMVQKAANETAVSLFTNQGQSCVASCRLYVHERVYEQFISKMKTIAESKVVGDPFSEQTTQGAITKRAQFEKVLGYIEKGKKEGARLVSGGKRVGVKGNFVEPTIFADVRDDMVIATEEILGPVLLVSKFSDTKEAINRANSTSYGLASGVFTNDISSAINISNSLDAGSVWVNCYEAVFNQVPFGGFKQSGFGRELGEYALHEYTEVKNVTIKIN